MGPKRLYRVDDERSPRFADPLTDACQVDE
jgi:hypothetical protein